MQLTPTGRQWCQAAFGQAPVESEIAVAARRHKSVSHGIAVLETAHHLGAAGYAVETEPGAVLAAADEPWHARAEPDLAFTLSGELWPVEVQREVSPRVVAKWAKSLELGGRLALVLYHEEARRKQQRILFEARYKLPAGRVLLVQHRGDGSRRLGPGRNSRRQDERPSDSDRVHGTMNGWIACDIISSGTHGGKGDDCYDKRPPRQSAAAPQLAGQIGLPMPSLRR